MAHFGQTLAALIRSKHLKRGEFAKLAGLGTATITRMVASEQWDQASDTYRAIAAALNLTPAQLDAAWKSAVPLPSKFTIPRVAGVSASNFREFEIDLMNEEGLPGMLYPYPARDPMCLRVHGDSMTWDRADSIADGDDVIFCNEFEETIPNNDIVVAKLNVDDSLTVKRVRFIDARLLELVAHNPRYDPIQLERSRVTLRRVKLILNNRYKGHQNG